VKTLNLILILFFIFSTQARSQSIDDFELEDEELWEIDEDDCGIECDMSLIDFKFPTNQVAWSAPPSATDNYMDYGMGEMTLEDDKVWMPWTPSAAAEPESFDDLGFNESVDAGEVVATDDGTTDGIVGAGAIKNCNACAEDKIFAELDGTNKPSRPNCEMVDENNECVFGTGAGSEKDGGTGQ